MKQSQSQKQHQQKKSSKAILGNGKFATVVKEWVEKAKRFTIEESKVVSIRAQEAGKLTALNAKRYKLKREYESICAEIGQQVLGLSEMGKKTDILGESKVQELIGKASAVERKIKILDDDINGIKKESDKEVHKAHQKAA